MHRVAGKEVALARGPLCAFTSPAEIAGDDEYIAYVRVGPGRGRLLQRNIAGEAPPSL